MFKSFLDTSPRETIRRHSLVPPSRGSCGIDAATGARACATTATEPANATLATTTAPATRPTLPHADVDVDACDCVSSRRMHSTSMSSMLDAPGAISGARSAARIVIKRECWVLDHSEIET